MPESPEKRSDGLRSKNRRSSDQRLSLQKDRGTYHSFPEIIEHWVGTAAKYFNWIAAGAVAGMMFLTVSDVVLRLFRYPIPGAYELVGFLGALFVSFSLAYTSVQKGHIAVEFLVDKLKETAQKVVEFTTTVLCALLFGLVAWQSVLYANSLKANGEVSLTIQIPLYPFMYGVAVGCALLTVVLFARCFVIIMKARVCEEPGVPLTGPGAE
jgi:TRAP-type C4-dicarboxylate transport system permease small subunit